MTYGVTSQINVGAAEKWFRKWDEINLLPTDEKEPRERNELFPLANAARVILWRIRLRLNPRQNQYKAEDDALLQSLLDLLDPNKAVPQIPMVPGSGSPTGPLNKPAKF